MTAELRTLEDKLRYKQAQKRNLQDKLDELQSEIYAIEDSIRTIKILEWNALHATNINLGDKVTITHEVESLFLSTPLSTHQLRFETDYNEGQIAVIKAIDTKNDTIHLSCNGIHRIFDAQLIRNALKVQS